MSGFGIFDNNVKTPMALNYKPEQAMRIIGLISEYEKTKNKLVRWLMFLQNSDSGKPLFLYKFARMSDKKYLDIRAGLEALYTEKKVSKPVTKIGLVPKVKPKPKEPQKELVIAGKK